MYGDRTPEDKATGPGIPDEDQGLRGIQDFVGFGTSWDSGLHETRDFVGFKTSPDSGLRGIQDFTENRNFAHPGPGSCSVVFSQRAQTFRITLKHGHHLV